MSATQRQIFVDDNDPSIEYGGGWTLETFNGTNATQLGLPMYGTLHVFTGTSIPSSANFSYTFNGSFINAVFNTQADSIESCLVDGQRQLVVQATSNSVYCQSKPSLQDGKHELFVKVAPTLDFATLFDGLQYVPSAEHLSVGDIVYFGDDPAIKSTSFSSNNLAPGRTIDFDFIGYSLGLYCDFSFKDPQTPSNISYTIDGQAPVNFTMHNVATFENPAVGPALVLQTPEYLLGQHHFHLDFLGTNDTVPFTLEEIIVQNTTSQVKLEVFPPISSSAPQAPISSSSSSLSNPTSPPSAPQIQNNKHKNAHIGIAIGVTAGAITALVLILGLIFCCRRKRLILSDRNSNSDIVVQPFILPTILQIGRGKERSGERQLERGGRSGKSAQIINTTPAIQPTQRVPAIIHADSTPEPPDESDSEMESLASPPAYSSVRRLVTSSNSSVALPPTTDVIAI